MSWLGRLFGRKRLERDLERELRFHLEEQTRDLIAAGYSAAEARRQAALGLGGIEQVKEEARDVRGTRWLEDWWHDTRLALRGMRRAPGFTAAAVLTLAVGIGANTAVFSVVDALLMKRLPVERPEQLSVLYQRGPDELSDRFSHPAFRRLQQAAPESVSIAAMTPRSRMYAAVTEAPEPVLVQLVSGEWFRTLGIGAAAGRLLGPADDRTLGGHPVAVLSYRYWERRFGRSPAVVGRTLRVSGQSLTIVGVADPGFFGLSVGEEVEVWAPIVMQHELRYSGNASTTDADNTKPWVPQDGIGWLTLVTRVKPPESVERVEARLDQHHRSALAERVAGLDSAGREYRLREHLTLITVARGLSSLREQFASPLRALMVSVGLVLLIACANLASLLLARGAARSHEVAVRVSLGARPGRLVRQSLTESVTLGLLGGAASLLVARVGGRALLAAASTGSQAIPLEIGLDGRLLGFALGVSLLTGILFGLAPAIRLGRPDLYQAFKTGGRVIGTRTTRLPMGRVLVVSQIALSLILVTAAGLFVRTLENLMAVDPGFDREHVVLARIDSRAAGYTPEGLPALHQRLLEGVSAVPGVRSASISLSGLATGSARISTFHVPGQTHGPEWDRSATENYVTPDYFATVAIPILRGRTFGPADGPSAPKVALVNETMARRFFGVADPIGQRFGYGADSADVQVIGVVRDALVGSLREDPPPMVFHPLAQAPEEYAASVEARVAGSPARAVPSIRSAIAQVDRALPVREVVALGDLVKRSLTGERFVSRLAGLFGALALLLASIGLYGLMAYSVARRANEMGVRLALGAAPVEVRWLVLRDTLRLVGLGVVVGLVLLVPSVGLLRSLVYGLSPRDPATMLAAAGILVGVGILAGLAPAWRASRVDPATALRAE